MHNQIEAIVREYKDQICDLKFQNSCALVQNQNIKIQFKQLEVSLDMLNKQIQRKDKNIVELQNRLARLKENNRIQKEELQKQLNRINNDLQTKIKSMDQQIQNTRNDSKKMMLNYNDTICGILNIKNTNKMENVFAKIKQLKEENDSLRVQINRIKEQYFQLNKKILNDNTQLNNQLENKNSMLENKENELRELRLKNEQILGQLRQSQHIFDTYKYNSERQFSQNILGKQEMEKIRVQNSALKMQISTSHKQIAFYRQQLKKLKQTSEQEFNLVKDKIQQLEKQKNMLREDLQNIRESPIEQTKQIQQELQFLLGKLNVKKDAKIKKMISDRFWTSGQRQMRSYYNEQSLLTLE